MEESIVGGKKRYVNKTFQDSAAWLVDHIPPSCWNPGFDTLGASVHPTLLKVRLAKIKN